MELLVAVFSHQSTTKQYTGSQPAKQEYLPSNVFVMTEPTSKIDITDYETILHTM
jgi:hypothetical protein